MSTLRLDARWVAAFASLLGLAVCSEPAAEPAPRPHAEQGVATDPAELERTPAAPPRPADGPPLGVALADAPPPPDDFVWLVAGGGATPRDNQVGIEADLALAAARFAGPGLLLFAGGAGSHGVQELVDRPASDPLVALLGDLFDPRAGRDARYRPTTLAAHGPATLTSLLDALAVAAERDADPLLIYLAGHGEPAASPSEVGFALWGGEQLTPPDLAAALDRSTRPVRVVLTSCFSGAFADLLFTGADPAAGPAPSDRCGLFAAPWDRPSSGCDPDPDRRSHEGYGLHLLQALAGRDRLGEPLPLGDLDLDGDGRVSLLEAHTRARIASAGVDVPVTTSELWLRHVAAATAEDLDVLGMGLAAELPEDDAVIRALGARLDAPDEAAALRGLAEAEHRAEALAADLQEQQGHEIDALRRIAAATLARWPVLDDPWHPDFQPTLDAHRADIEGWFRAHLGYHQYVAARDHSAALAARGDDAQLAISAWLRLVGAHRTRRLAGWLAREGGEAQAHFERLRACERAVVAVEAPR